MGQVRNAALRQLPPGLTLNSMGIGDHLDTVEGWHAAAQALIWQAEAGAQEAYGDAPINRYDLTDELPRGALAQKSAPLPNQPTAPVAANPMVSAVNAVSVAQAAAESARTLGDLRAAMAEYEHCEMKRGAKSLVFSDGLPGARVMIIGEAPGRDEDVEGRPFVGRAGQLLDRMFAAIHLSRTDPDPAKALYITNVMPWRPPLNRDPTPDEIAMMHPFLARHVALADPDLIVVMGNTSLFAALGIKEITRRRGIWAEAFGKPVMPMLHPAYLLRTPAAKREAWADLLALRARLDADV
jgi:uracil-DNA glycosylase family 4